MQKIKVNDEVIVIAGKDKGKRGAITKVMAKDRCLVGGVNMVKKHTKPNPQRNIEGGIVEREAPLHISNLAIYNAASGKADRVGFKLEEGQKVRIFKSSKEPIG